MICTPQTIAATFFRSAFSEESWSTHRSRGDNHCKHGTFLVRSKLGRYQKNTRRKTTHQHKEKDYALTRTNTHPHPHPHPRPCITHTHARARASAGIGTKPYHEFEDACCLLQVSLAFPAASACVRWRGCRSDRPRQHAAGRVRLPWQQVEALSGCMLPPCAAQLPARHVPHSRR